MAVFPGNSHRTGPGRRDWPAAVCRTRPPSSALLRGSAPSSFPCPSLSSAPATALASALSSALALTLALALLTGLCWPRPAAALHLPADQLIAHLLVVADREWRDWGQTEVDTRDGSSRVLRLGAVESDTAWSPDPERCTPIRRKAAVDGCQHLDPFDALARLRRYWAEGLGPDSRVARDPAVLERDARTEPWSAVFISFLMQQVGLARQAFPFNDAHSNYLRGLLEREVDAPAARPAQFEVLLASEAPIAAGDLLCGPRNNSRNPKTISLQAMRTLDDLQRLRGSHCDLVVAVDRRNREARLIGGNVADSVALTWIPLTRDGRAIRILSRPWFLIARPH